MQPRKGTQRSQQWYPPSLKKDVIIHQIYTMLAVFVATHSMSKRETPGDRIRSPLTPTKDRVKSSIKSTASTIDSTFFVRSLAAAGTTFRGIQLLRRYAPPFRTLRNTLFFPRRKDHADRPCREWSPLYFSLFLEKDFEKQAAPAGYCT